MALEVTAAVLAAGQLAMTWLALDRLPETVLPYGPTGGGAVVAGAGLEAELWTWAVLALWALSIGSSLLVYRLAGSSPLPVLTAPVFAALLVLRAGVIGLNLDPGLTPARAVFRAVATGLVVLLAAGLAEAHRTRRRVRPALVREALYDEPAPRGPYYWALASTLLPYVVLPTRIRVIEEGLLALTPVSYLFVPREAIVEARAVGPAVAVLGGGLNLATSPKGAVRIRVRGRLLPLVLSVAHRDQFLGALDHGGGD